jgi:hypothetical protein
MALLRHPSQDGKFVDDRFSALIEPNLFDNNVFQPNITFTDKYFLGSAGQIFIHRLSKVTVTPGEPGQLFDDTNTADQVIQITLDKAFRRSERIFGATAAAVSYPVAAAHLEQAMADIRESWNKEAAKALFNVTPEEFAINPGSVLGTTALTKENIYQSIVNDRAVLVNNGATPNVLIVSPAVYALLLQNEDFIRASDLGHQVMITGAVGMIAGLMVFEYQGLPTTIVDGTTTYTGIPEYVMYDFDAFSILTNVEVMRLIDSERFNGSLAQVEIVSGYKVTNRERVLRKATGLVAV